MGCVYDLYCAALAPQKSQSRLERGKKVEKATNAFCAGFSRASDEARRCLLAISGSRPHPVQCLTPTFLGPSACSLLSDVQTSLIFFFPEPQPACHPSLCGSSTSPPPSIGHLLKQGFQKKITYRIQYPTPIVGHLLISRCQMCPVCASIFKI